MNNNDIYRAALLLFPLIATLLLFAWRRPSSRNATAALFSFLWLLPSLLILHLLAARYGWWIFSAEANQLAGMPVDIWLGWALWWGPVAVLAFPRMNLLALAGLAAWVDLWVMPMLDPLLHLGSNWLWGETLALCFVLLPGLLLARWTRLERRLAGRVLLLVLCFIGLAVWLLPTVILRHTGDDWSSVVSSGYWLRSTMIALLAVPSILGLAAVYEFYLRGKGTPIPLDPPKQLVTTGPYAYMANPMQVSATLVWLLLGLWLQSLWVAAIAIMAVVFGVGLADWEERTALKQRMGKPWLRYRAKVRNWIPHWRPRGIPPARVYIAAGCGPCEQFADWLKWQAPHNLTIIPAQHHPKRDLTWITYGLEQDALEEQGIVAVARVLEHIHIGWAWFGWMIRLPLINVIAQGMLEISFSKPLAVCMRSDNNGALPSDGNKGKKT